MGAVAQHLLTTTRPNFGTTFANGFRPSNQGAQVRTATDISNDIIRPLFGTFTYHQSNGTSNYNALLVNVRRQMHSGLGMRPPMDGAIVTTYFSDDVASSTDAATPAATWRTWSLLIWRQAAIAQRRRLPTHLRLRS